MLVQNSVYRNTYLTDGVNKDFYFSFPILEASQVLVQTSAVTDTETVTTVDPGQYTVIGVGQTTGGHISFTTAPPSGSRLALTLNIPITQLYQYAELDSFPAKSHEDALAKLTLICQQLKEQISRAVKMSVNSQETPEDVVASIYASRDAAAVSASAASNKADAAEASAQAAHNSALDAALSAAAVSAATTTSRGIGRVATLADMEPGAIIENGPAFLAAGSEAERLLHRVTEKYDVGEFYYFRHPTMKPSFAAAQGGLISGAYQGKNITEYPIWDYLQTAEGQLLCKTEAEWQAMTTARWHTNADGTTVGWDGIGGAPYFVQDLGAGTLRMPDLRGMYAEAAGFDSLGVGGVHGDAMRNITGFVRDLAQNVASSGSFGGALYMSTGGGGAAEGGINAYAVRSCYFDSSRVVPVGAVNKPRAWGALACCYLGIPAA